MKRFIGLCFAIAALAVGFCACEEVGGEPDGGKHPQTTPSRLWMPAFLSDGMVVQQNSVATFWGRTNPNATVSALASWHSTEIQTKADAGGGWKLDIPTSAGSMEPQTVTIKDSHNGEVVIEDVLVGEVWHFAGQSNMEMPMKGFTNQPVANSKQEIAASVDMSHLRLYLVGRQASNVPLNEVANNKWLKASVADEARSFSAIAFFAGRRMAKELGVPVGILCTPYGGTRIEAWMPASRLYSFAPDDYKSANELSESVVAKSAPGLLYNAMIYPTLNYTVRGWGWYQGESNRDNPYSYARLQQAMVEEWRKAKGDTDAQMPFYYVQISGIGKDDISGADVIQAQWDALKLIPNSALITTSDVGDYDCIHYPNKKVPGERLGDLILHKTYGRTDIKVGGPLVRSVRYEGSKVVVTFTNGEGLHATQSPIPYVQVLDSFGNLHPATASIVDGTMEIRAEGVDEPRGVRYCYSTWHLSTVFNDAGIPLAPFKHRR